MALQQKALTSINLLALILLVYWNYLSNTGILTGKTMVELSAKYDSLFTPAGYAFSIWGLIYTWLLVSAVYLFVVLIRNKELSLSLSVVRCIPWLVVAYFFTGAWLYFWLNEQIFISVVVMIFILMTLGWCVIRNLEVIQETSGIEKWLFWQPVIIYFGWINVATIANIAAYLNAIDFSLGLEQQTWTILLIVIAAGLGFLMLRFKNTSAYALVLVWAFVAIGVRHYNIFTELSLVAYLSAGLVFCLVLVQALKQFKVAK